MVARRPLRTRRNQINTDEEQPVTATSRQINTFLSTAFRSNNAERRGRGRPTKYRPEYAKIAGHLCKLGATDQDLASAFDVTTATIWNWRCSYPEFLSAITTYKKAFDGLVERSLAQSAIGYTFDEEIVKINNDGDVFRANTVKHVPPNPTSAIFWLKNRRPDEWRDRQQMEMSGPDGQPIQNEVVIDARRILEQQLTAMRDRLAQEMRDRVTQTIEAVPQLTRTR
jgi:hypothetical protein